MAQAERLGDKFSDTRIARIYSSDLKRAHWTAIQVHTRNKGASATSETPIAEVSASIPATAEKMAGPDSAADLMTENGATDDSGPAAAPRVGATTSLPAPITTPLLREQNFGAAEGQPWSSGPYAHHDWNDYRFKFAGGEALVDVGARAEEVLRRIILPWTAVAACGSEDLVIVLTAHGIMISQLCQTLVRNCTNPRQSGHFGGLMNTSYHTFRLHLASPPAAELGIADLPIDDLPPPFAGISASYTLKIERTSEVGHLEGLKRQKGGIGRMAHDSSQSKLTSFFGGGGSTTNSPPKRTARA